VTPDFESRLQDPGPGRGFWRRIARFSIYLFLAIAGWALLAIISQWLLIISPEEGTAGNSWERGVLERR
jgi:hypothetical protein